MTVYLIFLISIFGCAGSCAAHKLSLAGAVRLSSCGSQASHGGDFSRGVRAQELLFTGSRARLRSCGGLAQSLHRTRNLPGPGVKPVSPALAGGFLFTVSPGKSYVIILLSEVSPPLFAFLNLARLGGMSSVSLSVGILWGWSRQHPLERCCARFCQTRSRGSRKSFLHLISQDRKEQTV